MNKNVLCVIGFTLQCNGLILFKLFLSHNRALNCLLMQLMHNEVVKKRCALSKKLKLSVCDYILNNGKKKHLLFCCCRLQRLVVRWLCVYIVLHCTVYTHHIMNWVTQFIYQALTATVMQQKHSLKSNTFVNQT